MFSREKWWCVSAMQTALRAAIASLALTMSLATAATSSIPPQLEGLADFAMPRFPPELVGVKAGDGEVVMAITIDASGKVSDAVALEATNDAFARAAARSVSAWQFTPESAQISSDTESAATWPRREVLQFSFKRSGVVTSLSHAEGARQGFIHTQINELRTVPWQELDSEPQRLAGTMPKVSKAALAQHRNKPLAINFVIDQEGMVRVPVVTAVDDVTLMQAVLDAVKEWRYSVPLFEQQPVAVEVTRVLVLSE